MMHRFCANRGHSNVLLLTLEQSGATLVIGNKSPVSGVPYNSC